MIEFFEFLNTCSPLRSVTYLVFILIMAFLTYSFIESIIRALFVKDSEVDDESESTQQLND